MAAIACLGAVRHLFWSSAECGHIHAHMYIYVGTAGFATPNCIDRLRMSKISLAAL